MKVSINKYIRLLFIIIISYSNSISYAQQDSIILHGQNHSAILEIKASNKALLLPRLDKNNVVNPADGLLLYDLPSQSFQYYNNNRWTMIDTVGIHTILGDTILGIELKEYAQDSVVFYIDSLKMYQFGGHRIEIFNPKDNLIIGDSIANGDVGVHNIFIGYDIASNKTSGDFNIGIGLRVLNSDDTGKSNIGIGNNALYKIESGYNNVAIGDSSLFEIEINYNNTAIGVQSGAEITTSGNVMIGYQAGMNNVENNRLYISNSSTQTPLIYGEFDTDYVQINSLLRINNQYEFNTQGGLLPGEVIIADQNPSGLTLWGQQIDEQTVDSLYLTIDTILNFSISNYSPVLSVDLQEAILPTDIIQDIDNDTKVDVSSDIVMKWGSNKTLTLNDIGLQPVVDGTDVNAGNGVFIGQNAANNVTGTNKNTIIGSSAGAVLTTGFQNTFIGQNSGKNVTGNSNVCIGKNTGNGTNVGTGNVIIGYTGSIPSGTNNKLYIENGSGDPLIEGDFGSNELYFNGNTDILYLTSTETQFVSRIDNLNLGFGSPKYNGLKITAGQNSNNGANSRFIEFYRPGSTSAIAEIRQKNSMSVNFSNLSDQRLKHKIIDTEIGLNDVLKIEVVDYEFINEKGKKYTGFLAQDLYLIFPEAVYKGSDDVKTDPWRVDYSRLTPILVKAIQEQDIKEDTLEDKLDNISAIANSINEDILLLGAF